MQLGVDYIYIYIYIYICFLKRNVHLNDRNFTSALHAGSVHGHLFILINVSEIVGIVKYASWALLFWIKLALCHNRHSTCRTQRVSAPIAIALPAPYVLYL